MTERPRRKATPKRPVAPEVSPGVATSGAADRARSLLEGVVDRVARGDGLKARPIRDGVDLLAGERLVAALRPIGGLVAVDVDPRAGAGDAIALRSLGTPHPDKARSAAGWRRTILHNHADAARLVHALRPARDKATNEPLEARDPLLLAGTVRVRRVTEPPQAEDGTRVFVDAGWPRGLVRDDAKVGLWLPDVGPSRVLSTAFGPAPARMRGFRRAYLSELRGGAKAELLSRLRRILREGPLTLLTHVRELDASYASVLAHAISRGRTPRA